MEWIIIGLMLWGMWHSFKQLYFKRGQKQKPLKMKDIPLSAHEWERFGALAIAMNKQTKTLLAEAVKDYMEHGYRRAK